MGQAAKKPKNEHDVATVDIVDDVAVIRLDDPDKKVNTVSRKLVRWFQHNLPQLERNKQVKAVVIISAKENGFVAGADIEELEDLQSRDEILALLREGHTLQRRTENGKIPTVAAIHGAALGGGLELALGCNYIVASNHPKTKLGQPEVMLGVIPGAGGCIRLPQRVGLAAGLNLILTGKQISAKRALKMGLVDEMVHPADLERVAIHAARRLARGGTPGPRGEQKKSKKKGRGLMGFLIEKTPLKGQAFDKARKTVLAKTKGKYPAPLRAIEVIEETYGGPTDRGLEVEAEAFADLVVSPEAKALMSIFFMKNTVDKRELPAKPLKVAKVGVLGAGLMGAGISQVLAAKGVTVRMKDISNEGVAHGLKYAYDIFNKRVKRRRMRPVERDVGMARITGGINYDGFGKADVVIEAVFEDLELKRRVLKETEAATDDETIFATNTSSLPITAIAEAAKRKHKVIGMHFFSPVHKMPLLEIIRTKDTDAETEATIIKLGRKMGKTVIVVNDGTGFFTSRALAPFMNEAAWCLSDGAAIEEIDGALTDFGFPVGPMTLIDEVGIDVGRKVGKIMLDAFGERLTPPGTMERIAADDRKGRKNGRGVYLYDGPDGEKGGPDPSVYDLIDWKKAELSSSEIADRCWLQMLNETVLCIEDGIISDPVDIDIGTVFGFGFPPFRGGLCRMADTWGLQKVVDRMRSFQDRHGDRFKPAQLLVDMAKANKRFHKDS